MPIIRQLPTSVINKIAAGEVIERPASVVKELLENSVDAGATRIDVSLAAGGMDLIRISDNGCGMTAEQLPLAVASHATSKISDADDLFRVHSFGFRGEALASIAEVSQFTLRSRTSDEAAAAELVVDGGVAQPIVPCAAPVGTTIEVRNLFFNTPVRRKFMRAVQTEVGHATEAFTRIALAHPQVHFTLKHLERTLYDLPPVDSWRERIGAFFGAEIEQGLIPLDAKDEQVHLSGFVANPQHSRGNNRMQYLFLNGRHIRDRALQHALGEAYRGLLLTGRFPIAFLRMEMPADLIDVNVHPTKLEVRFQDSGRVYSLLLGSLRKKFLTTDLTAIVKTPTAATADLVDPERADQHRRELVEWAKGELPAATGAEATDETQASLELRFDRAPEEMLQINRLERSYAPAGEMRQAADSTLQPQTGWQEVPEREMPMGAGFASTRNPAEAFLYASPAREVATAASPPVNSGWGEPRAASPGQGMASSAPQVGRKGLGFQIHNRYLITENEVGMVVIDQHALHERILYERLRERTQSGTLESQRLLVPEPVTLPPAEAAAALAARDVLSQLGIEIEPFGGDTILVSSYPAMLANMGPGDLLRQVIEPLIAAGKAPNLHDVFDELLHMIACKAAVKAGDHLSPEEITALLEQRHLCQDAHHCPHGRPTSLVFSREELDKRFKRT